MMHFRWLKDVIVMRVKTFKGLYKALWRCQEATASTLLSIHNIKFLVDFSQKCRQAILDDKFGDFYNEHYSRLF